jgi:hypothetical protein
MSPFAIDGPCAEINCHDQGRSINDNSNTDVCIQPDCGMIRRFWNVPNKVRVMGQVPQKKTPRTPMWILADEMHHIGQRLRSAGTSGALDARSNQNEPFFLFAAATCSTENHGSFFFPSRYCLYTWVFSFILKSWFEKEKFSSFLKLPPSLSSWTYLSS